MERSQHPKTDIRRFLKQFYKWLQGNNEIYPPVVAWIKTNIAKDDKPPEKEVLGLAEVRRLAESFKQPLYRYLTLMLFDSGFRISEMLSVTKADLTFEEFDGKEKCFWVFCRESKTITRKVPIPLFTDEVQVFANSQQIKDMNDSDPVFTCSYAAFLKQLKHQSRKLFGKKVTPHGLRHSSATYYSKAFEGNMNLIADRYGWAYNSREMATYIRKSGAYQKPQAKKIFQNSMQDLRDENEALKEKVEATLDFLQKLEPTIQILMKREKQRTKAL